MEDAIALYQQLGDRRLLHHRHSAGRKAQDTACKNKNENVQGAGYTALVQCGKGG